MCGFYFFFSSRRRHTRYWRDWSSDVCSSDLGSALDTIIEQIDTEPLEVFSFHRAVVNTNYKLWHDTNSEFYHDYLHVHNRLTSMKQEGYFDRKMIPYPNGQIGRHTSELQSRQYLVCRLLL